MKFLCGMESGRGAVKMGSLRCGFETIVGMKVPKRWCLRKSKGPGPEQSVIVKQVTWKIGVVDTCTQSASGLLAEMKFAQSPIAG